MAAYYTHCTTNFFTGDEENNSQMSIYNAKLNMVPKVGTSCEMISSPVSVVSFAEQFGVSDRGNGTLPGYDMGYCDYEAGEAYSSGPVPNIWPVYSKTSEHWGIQRNRENLEESEVKVGRYSAEERKDRILKYLKKRNQRNFNKTIKYACRKTLADKRIRIRGRFAKNNEPYIDDEMVMKTCDSTCQQDSLFYEDTCFQMKYDEDEVWQAAMANLVHFPYTSS